MKYRKFGNTGVEISALGFGCMRFPEIDVDGKKKIVQEKVNEMLKYAYDNGVNYFDTAPYYCNSNSEEAVGIALKDFRDKVYVSTKCPVGEVKETADFEKFLNRSLSKLDMDYVDFYHFWGINKDAFDNTIVKLGLIDEALRLKAEGKIRHISFSFHDESKNIKHIIDEGKVHESMLVQYNLIDRSNEEMIAYAKSKGLGVVAMGPVGGGRLSAPSELYTKLTGKKNIATYELAFKFVLSNENIDCALSGMENLDMVKQNIELASLSEHLTEDEREDIKTAMENLKKFSELYCTGCKYCQPCPMDINIPRIFAAYTNYNVYDLKEAGKKNYNDYITNAEKPGANYEKCVDCGFCEDNCPQKLEVRKLLKMVDEKLRA